VWPVEQENSPVMDAPDIFGVWRLQSHYLATVKTGERVEPSGAKPKGVLILHPERRRQCSRQRSKHHL
jgi:hypothetical protein